MNEIQYQMLIKVASDQCRAEMAEVKRRWRARIEALTWARTTHEMLGTDLTNKSQSVSKAISEALADVDPQFTVRDIRSRIQQVLGTKSINRSTVSGSLTRLVRDGAGIEIVSPGQGRRPTLYRKVTC